MVTVQGTISGIMSGVGLGISLGLAVAVLNGLWAHIDRDSYTWTKRASTMFSGKKGAVNNG